MTRIILVGGSRLLRYGLKSMLERAGAEVSAEFCTVEQAASSAELNGAKHVYLLKHTPGNATIRQEIQALKSIDPDVRVALMVEELTAANLIDTFGAGGDGLLLEEIGASALIESLKLIEFGEKVFPSQLATLLGNGGKMLSGERARIEDTTGGRLTDRELEIICCLTRGLSNKGIAREFDLSVATVKVHIKSILKKLDLSNRTQAAVWAIDAGLVEPPTVTVDVDGGSEVESSHSGSDRFKQTTSSAAPPRLYSTRSG